MRRPWLVWLAVLVPLWTVLEICVYWEPVMRDGWGHVIWHRYNHFSLGALWDYAKASYVHNNPRLGQALTLVLHAPGPWNEIITPLFELALFYLLAVLALGRWPSWRRAGDALVFATVVALVFASARSLGPMLFYRPFTGNYTFGLLLNIAWLIPYRLHAEEARRARWWWIPMMLVLGVASGLANEHTGPALVLAALAALVVYWRRGERFVAWAWCGLAGMIAGGLALFFAPGQEIRYNGLGAKQSLVERIAERGAFDNGKVIALFFIYMWPFIAWLAIVIVARLRKTAEPQPRAHVAGLAALFVLAFLIALTLLASPKQGDRLYFASTCLCAAAAAGWVFGQLRGLERKLAAALTVVWLGWVSFRLVSVYHTVGREFHERMFIIQQGPPLAIVTVPHYSQTKSRYILADDFETAWLRASVAYAFNLKGIEIR